MIGNILLATVYILLISIGIYITFLYNIAYYRMKKTKMIYSIYLLLLSILIENIYFGMAVLLKHSNEYVYNYLMEDYFWLFPKTFMLIALIYFSYTSLCSNEPIQTKKIGNKDKIFKS